MAITQKKPATKLTAGSQYICFNVPDENGDATEEYESEVIKLPTVVKLSFSDNADNYTTYASGQVYESGTAIAYTDISSENIAFPDALIERMKGNTVSGGVVIGGGNKVRPYFAYGFVSERNDHSLDLRWYPKCKLIENTDEIETSEEGRKDMHDTLTIRAFDFDEEKNKYVRTLTGEGAEGITEETYFAAPLLTKAAVDALKPASSSNS